MQVVKLFYLSSAHSFQPQKHENIFLSDSRFIITIITLSYFMQKRLLWVLIAMCWYLKKKEKRNKGKRKKQFCCAISAPKHLCTFRFQHFFYTYIKALFTYGLDTSGLWILYILKLLSKSFRRLQTCYFPNMSLANSYLVLISVGDIQTLIQAVKWSELCLILMSYGNYTTST